eukprot:11888441-Heterocapsa_arctica.AAC.1
MHRWPGRGSSPACRRCRAAAALCRYTLSYSLWAAQPHTADSAIKEVAFGGFDSNLFLIYVGWIPPKQQQIFQNICPKHHSRPKS